MVQYRLAQPQNLNHLDVQSAFLLLVRLESALPFGGRIATQLNDKGWYITGQSEKLRFDALNQGLLEYEPLPQITATKVHFALARQNIDQISRSHR